MVIIGLSNSKLLGRGVAKRLNVDYSDLEMKHEEEEIHFKFKESVKGEKVFLFQSFYPDSNNALMEVLFASSHARDLGAKEIILVAPYLSHLKEEFRKDKYECRSVKLMGEILSNSVDSVLVVDPFLKDLNKYFSIPVHVISCKGLIKNYVKENYDIVVGMGEESRQLINDTNNIILDKKIKKNEIKFSKGYDLGGKKVAIVDDGLNFKHFNECINYLNLKNKADCIIVHPLIKKMNLDKIEEDANTVVSCNTIKNETNTIDVSDLIARKIKNEWYT